MTDDALEKILRSALEAAGTDRFWRTIARMKKERVNPHRGTKKDYTWSDVKIAYKRQRGICAVCKLEMALDRKKVDGDHWNPNLTEEQGLNALDNCRAVHEGCNKKKGSKSVYELAQSTGRTVVEQLGDEP